MEGTSDTVDTGILVVTNRRRRNPNPNPNPSVTLTLIASLLVCLLGGWDPLGFAPPLPWFSLSLSRVCLLHEHLLVAFQNCRSIYLP